MLVNVDGCKRVVACCGRLWMSCIGLWRDREGSVGFC